MRSFRSAGDNDLTELARLFGSAMDLTERALMFQFTTGKIQHIQNQDST